MPNQAAPVETNEHNPAAQGKIAMPASWYLLTAHSSCIKQPIKHHAPRSLGLQRCSQYPACPHSQPRSSVPSLLQPASSPASSGGSRWSGALRPAGSTFACRFNFGCSSSRCRSSSRCWRSSRCWSSSRCGSSSRCWSSSRSTTQQANHAPPPSEWGMRVSAAYTQKGVLAKGRAKGSAGEIEELGRKLGLAGASPPPKAGTRREAGTATQVP